MSSHEYIVIPAPSRGGKVPGARTGIERFSATLSATLNEMAREGWEYVRAETLPAEERSGLTSRTTVYHNMLVFRRALAVPERVQAPAPVVVAPVVTPAAAATIAAPVAAPVLPPVAIAPEPQPEPSEPVAAQPRGPFSQSMRAAPKPAPKPAPGNQSRARVPEPPLTAPRAPAPTGPRLGPANR